MNITSTGWGTLANHRLRRIATNSNDPPPTDTSNNSNLSLILILTDHSNDPFL